MTWIQTWTGKQVDPLAAHATDIDIRDIAHALSMLCRFNGHCRTFYSVAEHAVRVSYAVPEDDALWGLLHDAAEAYVTDLPRPVKQRLPAFSDIEDALLAVIMASYGLPWPMPAAVAEADDRLLATELRDLMGPPPEPWGLNVEPLAEAIEPWPWQEAERRFLARFAELTGAR